MTRWRGARPSGTVAALTKGETMTTGDDQQLAGADTLGTVRQRLLELGRAALGKHPLLMAMATQIRVSDAGGVWFTFDSPALPEKQNCEVLLPPDPEFHRHALEAFMDVCEETLATAMKRAGLAWAHPVVGRGGGGASGAPGGSSTYGQGGTSGPIYGGGGLGAAGGGAGPVNPCSAGPSCGPVRVAETHGVAQGGGSGSACESEPSFHGSGPVD